METMNYREKKKKSLKGPIFGLFSFLALGTGFITYAMINEQEPVIVGNSGTLFTGNVPVIEENALKNIQIEDLDSMFEIKTNYISDTENSKIKGDITLPHILLSENELTEINNSLNEKFTKNFSAFKQNMSSVEHAFTYRVNYTTYKNIIKNIPILSIVVTEKMVEDATNVESMKKMYTYNIDLNTGKVLEQSDIIVDILGASYKENIKNEVLDYLVENKIANKDEAKYTYTGLEEFYLKESQLYFIFNSGDIAVKEKGILDIKIEKIVSAVDIYTVSK